MASYLFLAVFVCMILPPAVYVCVCVKERGREKKEKERERVRESVCV